MPELRPAVEDPAWVLAKYQEAKELLSEIRDDLYGKRAALEPDLAARVEDFWTETFMDACTTFSFDCACNDRSDIPHD